MLAILLLYAARAGVSQSSVTNGKIAFASNRDGDYDIYVMEADGSNVRRLTFDNDLALSPDWSPDGQRIVFSSGRDGPPNIYLINEDGSGLEQLTADAHTGDSYPVWSPDGVRIAFSRGNEREADLYVINVDGTGLTRIVDGNDQIFNLFPTWSPDGTRIMFVSTEEIISEREFGAFHLQLINLVTGIQREVRISNTYGVPDWSWTRDEIIFYDAGLLGTVIRTMDSQGRNLAALTSDPARDLGDRTRYDRAPGWSPDGTRIVFESEISPPLTSLERDTDIIIANADGAGVINLTPNNTSEDIHPDWQPVVVSRAIFDLIR